MHPNFYLSSLVACLALAITSQSKAADPLPLQNLSLKNLRKQFYLSLPDVKMAFPMTSDVLQFISQRTDNNQVTHIRLQQHYVGFVVYGGYAIMHSTNDAKNLFSAQNKLKMNGRVYGGLASELGQPRADFVNKAKIALQQFTEKFQAKDLSEEQASPIVYIDDKHQAHWAYRVSVYIRHKDKIPERPTAIIDASSYKPFIQWDDIKTARRRIKGLGYGGNSKTGTYIFGKSHRFLDLTRDEKTEKCFMENSAVKVIDMEHKYFSLNKQAMNFACKNEWSEDTVSYWTGYRADGYDKENGALSPSNDAIYSGYIIKKMYRDWDDVEVLAKKGKLKKIVMRVHYGKGYENAYWDGKQITFGDGGEQMYPLVSLGITAHELSHGFTQQHANLDYYGQPGGINESFSDMAMQAAEFYATGANTWKCGAEILKEDSGRDALRYMDEPSKDGNSIDSAEQYYEGLDVHQTSGVFNRLFYLIATTAGWDTHKAFDVMVKANMDYWTPTTNFVEAGCGVINAANDLGFSVTDIKNSLAKVAIDYESCLILGKG
jgi:pseudolysin